MWVPTSLHTIKKYVSGFSTIKKYVGEERGRGKMIFQRNAEDPSRKLAASLNISCFPG